MMVLNARPYLGVIEEYFFKEKKVLVKWSDGDKEKDLVEEEVTKLLLQARSGKRKKKGNNQKDAIIPDHARNGAPPLKKACGSRTAREAFSDAAPPLDPKENEDLNELAPGNSGVETQKVSFDDVVSGVSYLLDNATKVNHILLDIERHVTNTTRKMGSLAKVTRIQGNELDKYKKGVATQLRSFNKELKVNTEQISNIAVDTTKHGREICDLKRGAKASRRHLMILDLRKCDNNQRNSERLERLEKENINLKEQLAGLTK